MKFYDKKIQEHLLNGGKIRNNTYEGSYVIYIDDNLIIKKDNGEYYTIKGQDLSSDKWEIVETKYNWDKIIDDKVLCEFWDSDDCVDDIFYILGYLTGVDNKRSLRYKRHSGDLYNYCKPFNPADFNIAKDLKEYEK